MIRSQTPSKQVERSRRWYYRHVEECRIQNEKNYYANRIKILANKRAYYKLHPEIVIADSMKRRARKRNAVGVGYTTIRHTQLRWEMWGGRCWVCNDAATATDHVKPLEKGGVIYLVICVLFVLTVTREKVIDGSALRD